MFLIRKILNIIGMGVIVVAFGQCKVRSIDSQLVKQTAGAKEDLSKNIVQRYGVVHLSAVPLRGESSHKSEMVSQLLFGDAVEILKKDGSWIYVRVAFDSYEGWIKEQQLMYVDGLVFTSFKDYTSVLLWTSPNIAINEKTNEKIYLIPGSSFPPLENVNRFRIGDLYYRLEKSITVTEPQNDIRRIAEYYLGVPYLWGGRSNQGVDCSGFVQIVYKQLGIHLLRDSYQQATQGYELNPNEVPQVGDLVFFKNSQGKVVHVGMFIDQHHVIHASGSNGKVQIDPLNQIGFDVDLNKRTLQVHSIKRVIKKTS